jgi:hypothetical protein
MNKRILAFVVAMSLALFLSPLRETHAQSSASPGVPIFAPDPCQSPTTAKQSVPVSFTGQGNGATQLILSGTSGTKIFICGLLGSMPSGGTFPTAAMVAGTGSNCATGQTSITGIIAKTAASYISYTPSSTATYSPVGNDVCFLFTTSVGNTGILGVLTYVQQ